MDGTIGIVLADYSHSHYRTHENAQQHISFFHISLSKDIFKMLSGLQPNKASIFPCFHSVERLHLQLNYDFLSIIRYYFIELFNSTHSRTVIFGDTYNIEFTFTEHSGESTFLVVDG